MGEDEEKTYTVTITMLPTEEGLGDIEYNGFSKKDVDEFVAAMKDCIIKGEDFLKVTYGEGEDYLMLSNLKKHIKYINVVEE